MRITRVHVENYRSLKNFDLEPGPYCVLIGENNAGKSNVLKALNLILGETWPTERSFTEEDFYNQDTSQDIIIQVYFDETQDAWRNKCKCEVSGFELRCHAYLRKTGEKPAGSLKVDYCCIDKKGKQVTYPETPLESGKKPSCAWLPFRVSRDLRDAIPFIYIDVLRDYARQTPGSRWSILRRLLNEVNTEFLNDKKKVKVKLPDGTTQEMTRREAFENTVSSAYAYLRTPTFQKIEERLAANAVEHMGLDQGEGNVEIHFESHDPTNAYKSLQLYVEQMGIQSAAGDVGAGLQSAIVVAIFRTYEEIKKEGAVIAIEEPEVFLHPQKARYFESVLRGIAEGGNQIILTTHSPIFVELHKPESIAIIRRTAQKGTWAKQAAVTELTRTDREALRLLTEFDAERKELFFAKGVLLVEGGTEKVAMPLAFQALGTDINRMGISIIDVGGKTKIPLFAQVMNAFEIPYVVLVDKDVRAIAAEWNEKRNVKEPERIRKHELWNSSIESECPADVVFWLNPDFESELGLPREESEKIDRALDMFKGISGEDVPNCLLRPIEKLTELVTS